MKNQNFRSFVIVIGLGAIVLSNSNATAQNYPSTSEIDETASSIDKNNDLENEKRGGARAFSKPLVNSDVLADDDDIRMKRPGGRLTTSVDGDGHRLFKRPGARFMAPSGGGGGMFGGLAKRPGGRFFYGDTNRAKRPGGRYSFGQSNSAGMLKRLGGRYMLGNFGGGGSANRWKRAGGRHVGGNVNSYYGSRSYRTNWGRR